MVQIMRMSMHFYFVLFSMATESIYFIISKAWAVSVEWKYMNGMFNIPAHTLACAHIYKLCYQCGIAAWRSQPKNRSSAGVGAI